jgi:hypothetical protein
METISGQTQGDGTTNSLARSGDNGNLGLRFFDGHG